MAGEDGEDGGDGEDGELGELKSLVLPRIHIMVNMSNYITEPAL